MYDFVDFEVHFGGAFNDSGQKCYEGGGVTFFQALNAGELNFSKVKEMLVGCCNRPISQFFFKVPGMNLDEGLKLLCPETFTDMIDMALGSKELLEIYIQHLEMESESESDSEFDAYVDGLDNFSEDEEDDAASLDHMSEDDDEELISARVKLQEESAKKPVKKKRVKNDDMGSSKGKEKMSECGSIGRTGDMTGDMTDYASEYAESDEDGGGSVSESDDNQSSSKVSKRVIWPVFDPNTPWDKQVPENGMRFASQEQLRHMIINYSVSNGRTIRFARSGKNIVLAVCGRDGSCPWRLYATNMQGEDTMQIKSLNSSHSCVKRFKSTLVNTRWIAKEYESVIRDNTNWKLKDIQKAILDRHHVPVSLSQCYRAKQYVLHDKDGQMFNHYRKLFDYADELRRSNPGSTVELLTKQMNPGSPTSPEIFDKIYICFNALKLGWKAGCRPVIGLDGCFLKSYCKGELLSAIGRDGNNNMFPIAWAVVDVENTENWHWFLTNLVNDIGGAFGGGLEMTFISDQQKGLMAALYDVFPFAEHRNCARHIYANFRKQYKSVMLRNLFWRAAKSSTEGDFLTIMDEIKEVNSSAFQHLLDQKPNTWCRAFFLSDTCCDSVENNLSETFNAFIMEARKKPIIPMLEEIRQVMMLRLDKKKQFFMKYSDTICPRFRKRLDLATTNSRQWVAYQNGENMFEVRMGLDGYTVNLKDKVCSCRMWQLSGVPCAHAIACISYIDDELEKYVYHWLHKDQTLKCYTYALQPVNGMNMWPRSGKNNLLPPETKRMPGRPKKLRYKMWGEKGKREGKKVVVKDGEISRKGRRMRCTNCGVEGHNMKRCTAQRVDGDPELDRRRRAHLKKKNKESQAKLETQTGATHQEAEEGHHFEDQMEVPLNFEDPVESQIVLDPIVAGSQPEENVQEVKKSKAKGGKKVQKKQPSKGKKATVEPILKEVKEVTVESDESVEILSVKTGTITGRRKSMRLQKKADVQKMGIDSEDDDSEEIVLKDQLSKLKKAKRRLVLQAQDKDEDSVESSPVVASITSGKGKRRKLVLQDEDEDEDSGESSPIVASVSVKGKRRKLVLQDEEELEYELDVEATPIVTPRRSVRLQNPSPNSGKKMAEEEVEVNTPSSKKGGKKKVESGLSLRGSKKGKNKGKGKMVQAEEPEVDAQEVPEEPKLPKKGKNKGKGKMVQAEVEEPEEHEEHEEEPEVEAKLPKKRIIRKVQDLTSSFKEHLLFMNSLPHVK